MRKTWLPLAIIAALSVNATVQAQEGAPEDSTLKSTANSVTEPFDGKEVPDKLKAIQDDPYSLAGLRKCSAIIREVSELNDVLGPDVNEPADKSGEVTGANAERRRYAEAVYAGTVRRGFLKGVGLQRGCKAPARP